MSILRVYDPPECDERGAPLDWECCRGRDELDGGMGSFHEVLRQNDLTCPTCEGHGSLKAAAMFAKATRLTEWHAACAGTGKLVEAWPQADGSGDVGDDCHCVHHELRCESCSHPMSEGKWEDLSRATVNPPWRSLLDQAEGLLRQGIDPNVADGVHYSPCDEECDHGGPLRCDAPSDLTARWDTVLPVADADVLRSVLTAGIKVEASWRPVGIRCLGWPHDLRPERLAVLCLRCFAERSAG